ncbi:hypothetical protein Gotur_004339 [Gossypium turneri]
MASGDLERGGGNNVKNRGNSYNQSSSSSYYVENNEKQWTSWLVPMFVVANVAVFVVVMYVNNCPRNNQGFEGGCVARFLGRLSFEPLKENPLFGPSSNTLEKLGALNWDKVVHGNQAWRLITCIWLHAGVIHLLANMLSLIFIGIRLEQQFGFSTLSVPFCNYICSLSWQYVLGLSIYCPVLVVAYYRLFSFNVAFLLVPLVLYLAFLEQCCRSC